MFNARVGIVLLLLTASAGPVTAAPLHIFVDRDVAQAEFAAQEITSALREKRQATDLGDISALRAMNGTQTVQADLSNQSVVNMLEKSTDVKSGTLRAEGFSMRVTRKGSGFTAWIIGAGPALEQSIQYGDNIVAPDALIDMQSQALTTEDDPG